MNNYILIPNDIKTSDIPPGAKILYGDILYLSNLSGYCFASNNYFSKEYNVHNNSITNWIKSLKDNKYIITKYSQDDKGRKVRKIFPSKKCGSEHKKMWKEHKKNYNYKAKTKTKTKTKVVI